MKLETKYNLDDKVWVLDKDWVGSVRPKPCSFCEGKGRVTGADKSTYTCPKCEGFGTFKAPNEEYVWLVRSRCRITSIKHEIYKHTFLETRTILNYRVRYLDTGEFIPNPVEEQNLFRTQKSAQKEAGRRNKLELES